MTDRTIPGEKTGEPEPVGTSTGNRRETLRSEFMTGLRLIVLLLIFIAAVQLYFTLQGVIGMWVSYQFIPLVNAVYYIAVIIGGIWLLRGVLTNR